MKKFFIPIIAVLTLVCGVLQAKPVDNKANAAKEVVTRCFGFFPKNVFFKYVPKVGDTDFYALSVTKGKLTVEGSSPVAICKGFNDYIFENGYGIVSWTGNRLSMPKHLPDMTRKETVSPYQHHLYYNVCTYGYTTPFWGWERWEKEIDWMAMHGFDMPLAPIAGEAILARVWKQLGLTQEEIDDYFTGPAHFPWMRMGNIAHFQGGMSQEWFNAQIALEHKINDRELALGMTPVYQGFAGFVPKGIQNHYPNVKLTTTEWSSFDKSCLNHMLSPEDPLFSKIGTSFIKEWEKEFGKGTYYLIDSFNEMDIPFGKPGSKEVCDAMRNYGKILYGSIKDADPDAVWVMQGWILGYQRDIWTPETLEALLSEVPDDKMMIIDLAVDFNQYVWRNARSWDFFKGFYKKQWVWSTVPNFGGRSALVGPVDFYLNDPINALKSPNKGSLTGFGTSPEGVENNEITYAAISSAGWSAHPKDVKTFVENYSKARYGACPDGIKNFWSEMMQSSYNNFTSSAIFGWQRRPPFRGVPKMNINEHYYNAIEDYLSVSDQFKDNELYRDDAIMYGAFYLSAKADEALRTVYMAMDMDDMAQARKLEGLAMSMLADMDKLLESHPILRAQRWMDFAKAAGTNPKESENFVIESKRLISTWGGASLYDYSCRIWSGMIRDYYMPRLKYYFDNTFEGKPVNMAQFDESHFPVTATLSPASKFDDPVAAAKRLVSEYKASVNAEVAKVTSIPMKKPDYSKADGVLRLLTYNVGHFGKYMVNSTPVIAKMVNEINADAVAMQELDSCTTRSDVYQIKEFSDCMGGWKFGYQRAMPFGGGAYGIGVCTKDPIVNQFGVSLPKGGGSEPRALMVVETPKYVLASIHLDVNSRTSRLAQAKIASKALMEKYGNSTKPVFLAGDFNEDQFSAAMAFLRNDWAVISAKGLTYSTEQPVSCIDYVLALKNGAKFQVVKSYVCSEFTSGDVKKTSDHFPIFVDVKLQ